MVVHRIAAFVLFVGAPRVQGQSSGYRRCAQNVPVSSGECPSQPWQLDNCYWARYGELCEADGECGTSNYLNNCPDGYDIYLKLAPATTTTTTTTPGSCAATCSTSWWGNTQSCDALVLDGYNSCSNLQNWYGCDCSGCSCGAWATCADGYELIPVAASACPANPNLPQCDKVGPGEMCEGDGECYTDARLNNCGSWDVYLKAAATSPAPTTVTATLPATATVTSATVDTTTSTLISTTQTMFTSTFTTVPTATATETFTTVPTVTATTTPYPMCGGCYIIPLTASECPWRPGNLRACEKVGDGELCEGDGACGTDNSLNNCRPGNWDVYRKDCNIAPTPAPAPTPGPPPPSCPLDGLPLIAVVSADCPYYRNLPQCDKVAAGELCEGDGECGTDPYLNNCGTWDIYMKQAASVTETPFTTTGTSQSVYSTTATSVVTTTAPPLMCADGLLLTPVAAAACPWWRNRPQCDKVSAGELCEGDGECGTDPRLNNCGSWDIYQKAGLVTTTTPATTTDTTVVTATATPYTATETSAPPIVYPSCPDGLALIPADPSSCPSWPASLRNCRWASPGDYCEADGECGTDNRLNNCQPGNWDIYLKSVGVVITTTTTPAPPAQCSDGLELVPVAQSACPLFPGTLDNCDKVGPNEMCEGDGECNTDKRLNNCNLWDVYLKVGNTATTTAASTTVLSETTTAASTSIVSTVTLTATVWYPSCADGLDLIPITSAECPSRYQIALLPHCTWTAPGDLCEADGECGTNNRLNNCQPGRYDVYRKAIGSTSTVTPYTVTVTSLTQGGYPQCADGLDLIPVAPAECPLYKNLPQCNRVAAGELCEADGECGTDKRLNNCNPGGWDIYRKAGGGGSTPPPTNPSCADGIELIPVEASMCPPSIFLLERCNKVGIGEFCEADGECGTDNRLDNCLPGFWDVYVKGGIPNAPPNTTVVSTTATSTTPPPPLFCTDFLELLPVVSADCPWVPGLLPTCDLVAAGALCEGDGECGTDQKLNNCGTWDVYQKSSYPVCPDGSVLMPVQTVNCPADASSLPSCATIDAGQFCSASGECGTQALGNCGEGLVHVYEKAPDAAGTTTTEEIKDPGCTDLLTLVPVLPKDCPANIDLLPGCASAGPGEYCEADGECNTDNELNNCMGWDVYLKGSVMPTLPPVVAPMRSAKGAVSAMSGEQDQDPEDQISSTPPQLNLEEAAQLAAAEQEELQESGLSVSTSSMQPESEEDMDGDAVLDEDVDDDGEEEDSEDQANAQGQEGELSSPAPAPASEASSASTSPQASVSTSPQASSTSTSAASVAGAGMQTVIMSLTLAGINFDSLVSDPSLRAAFEYAIKATIVNNLPESVNGVGPEHVTLELSEGSVRVDATLQVPASFGTPAVDIGESLAASISSGSLATELVTAVLAVPGIDQATDGSISVTVSEDLIDIPPQAPIVAATVQPVQATEDEVTSAGINCALKITGAVLGGLFLIIGCGCCYMKKRRSARNRGLESSSLRDPEVPSNDELPQCQDNAKTWPTLSPGEGEEQWSSRSGFRV